MYKPSKIIFYLLLALFCILPWHAFLMTTINAVFFSIQNNPPWFLTIWKEIIILIITSELIFKIIQKPKIIKIEKIDKLITLFFGLALILIICTGRNWYEIALGIKFDLFFLFFFLILKHFEFSPTQKQKFIKGIMRSGGIAIGLGVLTYLFLPPNFLIYFGYYHLPSTFTGNTPIPYCHLISNTNQCRLQATFAGPNQFSSYLLLLLPILLVFSFKKPDHEKLWTRFIDFFRKKEKILLNNFKKNQIYKIYFAISILALYFTFSRSAWIAFGCGFIFFLYFINQNRKHLWTTLGLIITGITISLAVLAITNYSFFKTHIIRLESTIPHWKNINEGLSVMIKHPLGLGLGRAGPASGHIATDYYGLIPENWYIQIGLEMGILGLIIFLWLLYIVIKQFYPYLKKSTLLLDQNKAIRFCLFLTLMMFLITSSMLHTFEDAPTTLTFWGLLGVFWNKT